MLYIDSYYPTYVKPATVDVLALTEILADGIGRTARVEMYPHKDGIDIFVWSKKNFSRTLRVCRDQLAGCIVDDYFDDEDEVHRIFTEDMIIEVFYTHTR